uniref:Uncharacterized protein n=1 Tax=Populus alba TaxID=43335 RepID=A0A4V6A9E1_POPAL|nr:hypothetical protein D5086_0000120470 [Populus alba]
MAAHADVVDNDVAAHADVATDVDLEADVAADTIDASARGPLQSVADHGRRRSILLLCRSLMAGRDDGTVGGCWRRRGQHRLRRCLCCCKPESMLAVMGVVGGGVWWFVVSGVVCDSDLWRRQWFVDNTAEDGGLLCCRSWRSTDVSCGVDLVV